MSRRTERFLILSGIGRKLFAAFLLFSLLPLTLSIYQGYTNSRNAMRERILLQIETVSRYIENSITYFVQERELNLSSILAGNEYMIDCVKTIENPLSSQKQKEKATTGLIDHLAKKEMEDENSYDIIVLGKDGKILASLNPAVMGMDRSKSDYFKKGSISLSTSISYSKSVPTISICAPVQSEKGEFLGVLVKKVNISKLFELLKEGERLGQSSRLYFINSEFSVLKEYDGGNEDTVKSEGVYEAFQKKSVTGNFETSKEKRVAAAYRLISRLGWVLACEVDEDEAFKPLIILRNQAIAFGVFLFFILIGVAYYITKGITKPIQELAVAAREIGKGDFSRRVKFKPGDEIGDTALAFNIMADRLEEKVLSRERFITNITESSVDAIISLDNNNYITTWNRGAEEMFGYGKDEVLGRHFEFLIPPDLLEKRELEWLVKETEKKGVIKNYETERITKSGQRIQVAVTRTVLRDSDGNIIGCSSIVRDITEKKNLEKQLIQSEKLSAVGELTAGLAHEIGTPLNIISGRAEYLLSLVKDEPKITSGLKSIIRQIDRITLLIQQLLKFTRSEKRESRELDINRVIKDTLLLLETKLDKSGVMVNKIFSEDIPLMEGDENQIQQVFINLFLNALHAMPEGGELEIKTKWNNESGKSGTIEIVVSDTGAGIEEKNISRIFDPFFTTKEIGKGTGLGLAVTYGIIKDHGGTIDVISKVNTGTSFYITFPCRKEKKESVAI
ncbi:MAG: PAS domain S-box protein [Candidatus Schekmanbacteria bacterium]|nr:PAS domain S-box protein [Candidatus Schekmanbacteria bacterium]